MIVLLPALASYHLAKILILEIATGKRNNAQYITNIVTVYMCLSLLPRRSSSSSRPSASSPRRTPPRLALDHATATYHPAIGAQYITKLRRAPIAWADLLPLPLSLSPWPCASSTCSSSAASYAVGTLTPPFCCPPSPSQPASLEPLLSPSELAKKKGREEARGRHNLLLRQLRQRLRWPAFFSSSCACASQRPRTHNQK